MPLSPVVRRMGGLWSVVVDRSRECAADIPPDGVSRADFASVALDGVDEQLIEAVLGLLHRRQVVWIGRHRGEVRVFASRPQGRGIKAQGVTTTVIGRFLAALAPHVPVLTRASREMTRAREAEEWQEHANATDQVRVACVRILRLCYAHHERGVGLTDMREALWDTFNDDAMHALVFHDPRLQRGSKHPDLLASLVEKRKRIARGLSIDDRVLALIKLAGDKGLSRSNITQRLRPKPKAIEVEGMTSRLMHAGLIFTTTDDEDMPGKPGRRYFATTGQVGGMV